MDPTIRKPKPNPSAAANRHHLRHLHPLPDPTPPPPPPPSTTIKNISHRFSKLYSNHKKPVSHSFEPDPHPQPDPHFKTHIKDLTFSPVINTSCTTLTKSSSQKEKITKFVDKNQFLSSKTNKAVKEKDDFKNSSFEECELKKGFEIDEGLLNEVKRRSSVSSIIPPPVVVVSGGRRRSFCNSQVELADFLSCSGVKVVAVDMPPFMQIHAVDCARKTHDSLEKFTSKTLAYTLKKEFDGVYGPAWHCIVGTSFGSFVTHSVGGFMYFSMDHKLYILLFKTTVQRAE